MPGQDPYRVTVDEKANALQIVVDNAFASMASGESEQLEETLGVPVNIVAGVQTTPTACDRDDCSNPSLAGDRVKIGYSSTDIRAYCTMGFHIVSASQYMFLSAGHCAKGHGPYWYHNASGYIGRTYSDAMGAGYDLARVTMSSSEASNLIYGSSWEVQRYEWPTVGHAICASLGNTDVIDCGQVSASWTSYTLNGYSGTYWGGGYRYINMRGGDSGSPLYCQNPYLVAKCSRYC